MNHRTLISAAVWTAAFIFVSGCSSGFGPDAVAPEMKTPAERTADWGDRHLWGLWQVFINADEGVADVVPLRGPQFTANVNNLLESKPGNLIISDLDTSEYMTQGRLDCTVTLKHPFPGMGQYNGFDVWGVFMHNGEGALNYQSLTYGRNPSPSQNEAVLLNSDGYTRWFNCSEFSGSGLPLLRYYPGKLANLPQPSARLNGYKIFADGLGALEDYGSWIKTGTNADNRGIFRAGSANSRRYQLQFPVVSGSPVLKFQYAVVASWEPGDPALTGNPALYDPGDFPASANCAEAFFVAADTGSSTLYNDGAGHAGGSFVASIEVFDWQGGKVGGTGVVNEVNRLIVEGSFIPSGTFEFSQAQLAAVAQPGTENSSVFEIEITGCSPKQSGKAEYWLIVEAAGMNSESYGQGFPAPYPDSRRAAFLRSTVDVSATSPSLGVTGIEPNSVPFWSIVNDAHIYGYQFKEGATVQLRKTGQSPVNATDVVWIDSGNLTCDFNLRAVDSGKWDVVVINPDTTEGTLPEGLTIKVWSDEEELAASGCRLPRMAETSTGSLVLVTGNNDSTMKYRPWDGTGGGWSGPYLLANGPGNNLLLGLNSDPVNDYVYLASGPSPLYRYTGGTGPWETQWNPIAWNRCATATADKEGRLQIFNNTSSAFGFVIQHRAPYWGYSGNWDYSYFMDSYNDKTLSYGNIIAQDSKGTIFCAYEKDRALDPYSPQPGPRSVRVGIALLGQLVGYNFRVIEETYEKNLDSPAITCSPDNVVHVIYRHFIDSSSEWRIEYERSTDGGNNWGSKATVWSGTSEPEKGYACLYADSVGNLHAVYGVDWRIEYKSSTNGSSWSSAETVNESGSSLTPPIEDYTPNALVTGDGILHVVWIRGNPAAGYGALRHRMRDLM